jgi:hypothetical protein
MWRRNYVTVWIDYVICGSDCGVCVHRDVEERTPWYCKPEDGGGSLQYPTLELRRGISSLTGIDSVLQGAIVCALAAFSKSGTNAGNGDRVLDAPTERFGRA